VSDATDVMDACGPQGYVPDDAESLSTGDDRAGVADDRASSLVRTVEALLFLANDPLSGS
jgi:hypothetical protein